MLTHLYAVQYMYVLVASRLHSSISDWYEPENRTIHSHVKYNFRCLISAYGWCISGSTIVSSLLPLPHIHIDMISSYDYYVAPAVGLCILFASHRCSVTVANEHVMIRRYFTYVRCAFINANGVQSFFSKRTEVHSVTASINELISSNLRNRVGE